MKISHHSKHATSSKTHGFTLLELIIVIIIIGVLASLALPRLFSVIEYSRSAEALSTFTTIRSALERCYLINNGTFENCKALSDLQWKNALGMENPGLAPNAHFTYEVSHTFSLLPNDFMITAKRNSIDGGDECDMIAMVFSGSIKKMTFCGTGVFAPLTTKGASCSYSSATCP